MTGSEIKTILANLDRNASVDPAARRILVLLSRVPPARAKQLGRDLTEENMLHGDLSALRLLLNRKLG